MNIDAILRKKFLAKMDDLTEISLQTCIESNKLKYNQTPEKYPYCIYNLVVD